MHFEILTEDLSGKTLLEIVFPKITDGRHTCNIYPYKGIGSIPKNLKINDDNTKKQLLTNLPKLLNGFGNTYSSKKHSFHTAILVVCDLDDRCLKNFREELWKIHLNCRNKPETRFCIAVEESEAWLLGDSPAIKKAYPNAKDSILKSYPNDAVCGTWEKLADAIFPGGQKNLKAKGWQEIGRVKSEWARNIGQYMNIKNNASPSFNYLIKTIQAFY